MRAETSRTGVMSNAEADFRAYQKAGWANGQEALSPKNKSIVFLELF
jgi:hypothetical protein